MVDVCDVLVVGVELETVHAPGWGLPGLVEVTVVVVGVGVEVVVIGLIVVGSVGVVVGSVVVVIVTV